MNLKNIKDRVEVEIESKEKTKRVTQSEWNEIQKEQESNGCTIWEFVDIVHNISMDIDFEFDTKPDNYGKEKTKNKET